MPPRKAEGDAGVPEGPAGLARRGADGPVPRRPGSAGRGDAAARSDGERLMRGLRERARAADAPLRLVRADAAVLAALPPERAEAALQLLVRERRSHLAVTEDGDLVYEFAPGLPLRDARGSAEQLARAARAAGAALWRGFQIGFKVWISVTLVLYTVIFALLGLALMLVAEDDGPGGLVLWLLPDLGPIGGTRQRGAYDRLPGEEAPRKRFHRSVFDYVFGPPQPAAPLKDDRPLLGEIRRRAGRLTATDLALLQGVDLARAEEEATRLLAAYDGEPVVTETGALVYSFPSLRRTALAPADANAAPLARYEPEPPLTGNGGGVNAGITALNAFNLVAALTLGPLCALWLGLAALPAALLTVVPLVFSLLFFAVPAGRALRRRLGRAGRTRRNLRRALLGVIAERGGAATAPAALRAAAVEALTDAATEHGEGQRYSPFGDGRARRALLRQADKELERLLVELDGDVLPPSGDEGPRYAFPRLGEELRAAAAARAEAQDREAELGPIIFSSASEGAGV